MSSPLRELILARFRVFYREPSTIFWSFVFPILLTVSLGVAFRSRPPEPIEVGVVSGSQVQPEAARAHAALGGNPELRVHALSDDAAAQAALRTGKVAVVVSFVAGAPVLRFDPTRPESRLARLAVKDQLDRAVRGWDVVAPAEEHVTEPGGRYIDFLLPGLVGVNIMSTGMWGIGYGIVDARTKKLLKRMIATPMRRRDFLLSFVVVRLSFLALEVPLLIGFGMVAFGTPFVGSMASLGLVALLGALSFSGLGLLVASRAGNIQVVSGLINVVMMPMYLLSGVFFSSSRFPEALQPLIRALPLTALNDAMRAVLNEGAGLTGLLYECGLLAGTALVSFVLALRLFRWS